MKKARKIWAAVLTVLLAVGMTVPVIAGSNDIDSVDVSNTEKWTVDINETATAVEHEIFAFRELVNKICPEYSDLVDYDTIGGFSQTNQIVAPVHPQDKHPVVDIPSVASVRSLSSTEFVSLESELEDALDDPSITVILLTDDIILTQEYEIDHSVTIMALSGTKTLTSAYGCNHFEVYNQSATISITFSNVILDGDNIGGGIYILDSDVTINNAVIQNCFTSASTGGPIYASNTKWNSSAGQLLHTGHVTVNGGTLSNNESSNGAITVMGTLDVTGTNISYNQGGGITAINISSQPGYVNLTNVKIMNNSSTTAGGGIYLFGAITEIVGQNDYSEISNNTSTSGGGGIYSDYVKLSLSNTKVNGNTITGGYGAGIVSLGKLDMTNVEVKNNKADVTGGYGAGVYARNVGRPGTPGFSYNGNDEYVTITGCTISNNKGYHTVNGIQEETPIYGGGLMIHNIIATISNTSITNNIANIGGGICALYDNDSNLPEANISDVTLSNVTVSSNTAHENGGGVILYGDDLSAVSNPAYYCRRILVSNGTIYQNTSCIGGGLLVIDSEAVCDNGITIQSNIANSALHSFGSSNPWNWNSAGAGVLLYNSVLTLNDASITSNQLLTPSGHNTAGAGIYAKGESSILLSNATAKVNNNTGAGYGGGIYTEVESSLTISNGEVKSNSARFGGGVETYCGLIMSGGTISNNTSSSTGGGVLAQRNTANTMTVAISGGTISGNNGGNGAGIYSTAPINMTGGTIQSNTAAGIGGGIYTTAALTITAGSILNNTANTYGGGINATNTTTIGLAQGSNTSVLIQGNSAANGAGLAARGSMVTYTLNSGTISGNTATSKGGGIYCVGTFNMQNGNINGNSAVDGAGIYITKAATLYGGTISQNVASNCGGGLYIKSTGAVVNSGCSNSNNTAQVSGNDVYVESGGSYT